MSSVEPNMHWRGRTLRAVRRHLRLIEVQTHRLRAKLARLEADHEEDVADYLNDPANDGSTEYPGALVESAPANRHRSTRGPASPAEPAVRALPKRPPGERSARQVTANGAPAENVILLDPRKPPAAPSPVLAPTLVAPHKGKSVRDRRATRKSTRPMLVSLGVHAAALLICLPLSYVTLTNQNFLLLARPPEPMDEAALELTNVAIETTVSNDLELQNVAPDQPEFNLSNNLLDDATPLDSLLASDRADTFGQSDALPSDLGTLMAGAGKPDGGQVGGPRGSAVFFGTKSEGDRFVFVVDNSDSMSGGRLENAIAELVRCVEALSRKQSFYVIFVSDQVYPMFFPERAAGLLPATAENKRRLAEWLPRARRAGGRNREIITAMDLASSLQPHAVFFLWDGRIDHGGVRQDVMTHLTRPNQWNFPIHTLGIGIESLDSEYNLSVIAQANGGTYRRVELPKLPARK